jgi:biotin carboxyl carrier protein
MQQEIDLTRLIGDPLTGLAARAEEDSFQVLSPGVGLYDMPPAVGAYVRPGSFLGYLTVVRRYYHLVLPEGRHGVVTHHHIQNRKHRVEYGQPLLTVSPEVSTSIGLEVAKTEAAIEAEEGVPEGMFAVKSPTDGIFYGRPNPQSPFYVEEGTLVTKGTVLGLVEVMKCFNPISYPGEPELPNRARIAKVVAQDATEVKHGGLLFVVEEA